MFVIITTRRGFIHIARAGGTYIRHHCERLPGYHRYRPTHGSQPGPRVMGRGQLVDWCAMLRDPVDRFVSMWQLCQVQARKENNQYFYLQRGQSIKTSIFTDWGSWCDWHHDHPTQPSQGGIWSSQSSRVTASTRLYLFPQELDLCVSWLGGVGDHVPRHGSGGFTQQVTASQRAQIEQHYAADLALWQDVCSTRTA